MELLTKELERIEKEYKNEEYTPQSKDFLQNTFWREIKKQDVGFFIEISQNLYEITGIEEYRQVIGEKEVLQMIDNIIDDMIDNIMNSEEYIEEGDDFYIVLDNAGLL